MLKKGKRQVGRGDIFKIPLADGKIQYAQVCWSSGYFKDLIQIVFLKDFSEDMPTLLEYLEPSCFTSSAVIRSGRWPKVSEEKCVYEPYPPLFHSAGDVWRGDDCLRPATDKDLSDLPKLQALGAAWVEEDAQAIQDLSIT